MGWPGTKPLSTKKMGKLMIGVVKRKAVQLTYGPSYYRQIVLELGSAELEHYRPFLSDLHQSLTAQLSEWYALQEVPYGPMLILKRSDGKTSAWGGFEETPVEDALLEACK